MKRTKKEKRRLRMYLFTIVALLSFFGYKMYYYWPRIFTNYKDKVELENQYIQITLRDLRERNIYIQKTENL